MTLPVAWSKSVTIDGNSAHVRDLDIVESSSNRIPRMRFTIEAIADNATAYDAAVEGATVVVTQTVAGETITNTAEIVSVSYRRGRNWTQKEIQANGLEYRAKTIRILEEWEQVRADQIVTDAWTEYASHLGLALDVGTNSARLSLSLAYDPLFDLMEQVCQRTAWAWRIENGTMRFFNPLDETSPGLSQDDNEIRGNTLQVDRSLQQVTNVARAQAWVYRRQRIRVFTDTLTCRWAFDASELIDDAGEWEVVGRPEVVEDFVELDEPRQARWIKNNWIEFDPAIEPQDDPSWPDITGGGVEVVVSVRQRMPAWMVVKNAESIAEYGEREGAPVYGNGVMGEDECEQFLTEHLARYAFPTIELRCDALKFGYRPDSISEVALTDPQTNAQLYVTEVRRTVQGNELTVSLSMASPIEVLESPPTGAGTTPVNQRPSKSDLDPVTEMIRRIEKLERAGGHPASTRGFNTRTIGDIVPSSRATQGWGWAATAEATADLREQVEVTDGWGWSATIEATVTAVAGNEVGGFEVAAEELG